MTWQRIAAPTGGTVAGLATGGRDLIFAATSVGVFRSMDAGRAWTLMGSRRTVPFAEALALAEDGAIFVGARDGLYRSTDAGSSWHGVVTDAPVLGVCVAPAGVVVVATETDGVLRSDDGGASWSGANAGLLDLTALAVALSPCFAADRTGFVGTTSGLYRTRNGARSWRAVETDLDEVAVQCLGVSPGFADDRLVLAGTEQAGLLVSHDAGTTWQQAVPHNTTAIAFSAQGAIAVATEAGIALSYDGGRAWQIRDPGVGTVLSLAFAGNVLLAGVDRLGVARSEDGGATWHAANDGLTAVVPTAFALAPDNTLLQATLEHGIRVSRDGGLSWREADGGLGDAVVFGLSASLDGAVYAATSAGLHVSRDAGATWLPCDVLPGCAARAVAAGPALAVCAFEGGRIYGSVDAGATWRALPPAIDGDILALAQPDDRTIFLSTSKAGEIVLWRATNQGQTWGRWLIQSAAGVVPLAVSPTYLVDDAVFVGVGSRVFKPMRNTRETRGGETRPLWQSVELAGATAVTALALSPDFEHDRVLVAATNAGVCVSRNAGETFLPWSDGLEPPGVVGLAIGADGAVYAISPGGSIWRRSMTDE